MIRVRFLRVITFFFTETLNAYFSHVGENKTFVSLSNDFLKRTLISHLERWPYPAHAE